MSLPFDLIYRIWTLHTFELEASFVSQPLLQCERLLSAPLLHPQLSRPEQSGAGPTSTDKPLFFVLFFGSGLGRLPADNDAGHTCRINDWSALPPALAQVSLF